MKIIAVIDDFNKVHYLNVDAITEFVPGLSNSEDCGAIEMNNGRRVITTNKRIKEIIDFLAEDKKKESDKNG